MYGTFSWGAVIALIVFVIGWHFWVDNEKPPEDGYAEWRRAQGLPPKLPSDNSLP